jgi:hypothetical protein
MFNEPGLFHALLLALVVSARYVARVRTFLRSVMGLAPRRGFELQDSEVRRFIPFGVRRFRARDVRN